jgi:hypothetical protein
MRCQSRAYRARPHSTRRPGLLRLPTPPSVATACAAPTRSAFSRTLVPPPLPLPLPRRATAWQSTSHWCSTPRPVASRPHAHAQTASAATSRPRRPCWQRRTAAHRRRRLHRPQTLRRNVAMAHDALARIVAMHIPASRPLARARKRVVSAWAARAVSGPALVFPFSSLLHLLRGRH